MSTQSDRDTINQAVSDLEFELVGVPAAIVALLNVPPPKGDGAVMAQIADGFKNAASAIDQIALQVVKAASQDLPEVWLGAAADLAGDVVVAVGEDLERGVDVCTRANTILSTLAAAFDDARKKYSDAQGPLHRAQAATDNADYGTARSLGFTGANLLLSAIDTAVDAGKNAARGLSALADQARAHEMNSSNLSSSDKLILAESAVPGGPHDLNLILSESDAQRAAQRFDQLSPADRQRMDQLLAQAKSPQERAYLMKTLAAGHSLDEVANFDALIHNHGDDPVWLQQPIYNPWGTTNWVDEDDFLNGHMDKIDPSLGKVPPNVSGVLLPR